MKFGFRPPSLKKRIAARTSVRRYVAHSLGFKAPRGMGLLTNPKKALYNRVYSCTTIDPLKAPRRRRSARSDEDGGNVWINLLAVILVVALMVWLFHQG